MPISDFFSTFFAASARSSAITAASSIGGGRSSAWLVRIAGGTVFAARSSSVAAPTACSIAAMSDSDGPM